MHSGSGSGGACVVGGFVEAEGSCVAQDEDEPGNLRNEFTHMIMVSLTFFLVQSSGSKDRKRRRSKQAAARADEEAYARFAVTHPSPRASRVLTPGL